MLKPNPKSKISIPSSSPDQWDEAFKNIPWWNSEKIVASKVMVVGAGALGNEVLKNLALLGIGYLFIVDFDHVEYSNLSKSILFREADKGRKKALVAKERVLEINPNIKVNALHGDIIYSVGLGIFRQMDVIIGCLDNRIARLYINKHAFKVGKTWIDGGIEDLNGQMDVYAPNISCYECQLDENAWKIIRYRLGCNDIAQRNANFGRISTTPISSSIIAAMQVQEALKVIFGNEKQLLTKERFTYWGMANEVMKYETGGLKDYCTSNCRYTPLTITAADLSAKDTLGKVMAWLKEKFDTQQITIRLDYDLVLEVTGKRSEKVFETLTPAFQFSEEIRTKYQVIPGEDLVFTQTINYLNDQSPYQEKSLEDLGIPLLQILTVETDQHIHFVELAGDQSFYQFNNL